VYPEPAIEEKTHHEQVAGVERVAGPQCLAMGEGQQDGGGAEPYRQQQQAIVEDGAEARQQAGGFGGCLGKGQDSSGTGKQIAKPVL
jgi:hypothetical protein